MRTVVGRRWRARAVRVILAAVVLATIGQQPVAAQEKTRIATEAGTQSGVPAAVALVSEAPKYEIERELGIPVTMSDGAVLLVDVSYPTNTVTGQRATGPFPVLLLQNPYEASQAIYLADSGLDVGPEGSVEDDDFLVEHGYIFVHARVRGTGGSGGKFCFLCEREQQDGAELVAWASKLAGSTGEVGLNGCSYLGLNQWFTAARVGPDSPLKVMAPRGRWRLALPVECLLRRRSHRNYSGRFRRILSAALWSRWAGGDG